MGRGHRFPRRSRRGATTTFALLIGLAIAIPLIVTELRDIQRERELAILRAETTALAEAMNLLDQEIFLASQDPTRSSASWLAPAGLRSFSYSNGTLLDTSIGDRASFFTLLEPADGLYWGGAVVDLVGLNTDAESAVISALSYLGDLDDGGFETAKDRYELVLGSSISDTSFVVFFNNFNGLDEAYVFREVRPRQRPNALTADLQLSGQAISNVQGMDIGSPDNSGASLTRLTVAGSTTAQQFISRDSVTVSSLTVTGGVQAESISQSVAGASSQQVSIAQAATFNGNLGLTGALSTQSLDVSEAYSLDPDHNDKSVTIGGSVQTSAVNVTGQSVIAGQSSFGTNLAISGDVVASELQASFLGDGTQRIGTVSSSTIFSNTASITSMHVGSGGCFGC
jgi:hypothetical protein